jgi:crossover junction endodeoxyribonuclease RusA
MRFDLPYPPSINHYWRRGRFSTYRSADGKAYRGKVVQAVAGEGGALAGRLAVRLDLSPPDRRRRDLDNIQKPLLDALQYAGVYLDDSQIDVLLTVRCPATPGGGVTVTVSELPTIYPRHVPSWPV